MPPATPPDLPSLLMSRVLVAAGSWNLNDGDDHEGDEIVSSMSVCRQWRDCLLDPPCMAELLIGANGRVDALFRAIQCLSPRISKLALMREVLKTAEADCMDGAALTMAAVKQ